MNDSEKTPPKWKYSNQSQRKRRGKESRPDIEKVQGRKKLIEVLENRPFYKWIWTASYEKLLLSRTAFSMFQHKLLVSSQELLKLSTKAITREPGEKNLQSFSTVSVLKSFHDLLLCTVYLAII